MFVHIYTSMLIAYIWFTFILIFYDEVQNPQYNKYDDEKISVIVPCYNETPELLRKSVLSVCGAYGNKEIYIIDDGSTNNVRDEIDKLVKEKEVKAIFFDKNRGKREALHKAVKNLVQEAEYVVTIDSDTILDPEALIKIVEPLKDPKIGASTGDVRLINEKQNWLTRMIGSYYWVGLNIYKKAQSSLGNVVCCSGCLAAYKADILKEIIDEFASQEFFGEKCTHSEDRHLTNLV